MPGKAAYERGLAIQEEVLGREHVDRCLAGADEFTKPLQDIVTGLGWGEFWSRPGLTPRSAP
jgi:4-carboxymuconolactone decarboxylase